MSHILMVNIPAHGHVFPTLAVVGELVRRGHRVTYAAVDDFAQALAEVGAEHLRYDSTQPLDSVGGPENGRTPLIFLDENIAILRAVQEWFGDARPDAVVYDAVAFQAGRILAHTWGLPAVQSTPFFASNDTYSFVQQMMEADGAVPLTEEVMVEFGVRMAELLASHGIDEPAHEFMMRTERLNLVHVPRFFQPHGESFDERFAFVGPCLTDRSFLGEWRPPASGLPVALVSMGTVHNRHPEFFRLCVDAFAELPWHAVISVGGGMDPADLGPLPDNVEVHRWVSHLTVLRHARLVITHGGMGGVLESLDAGCPILGVPSWPDVAANTARVAELGLGRVLLPAEADVSLLRAAITEVAADAAVRERGTEAQRLTREAGGATRAADEIEAYLKRTT
ncbi:macrolide family glycosyltransferase [Kitasatospora sp. NPDC048286]|uniref:macrolide family glycosyltransferase n=1 Tax=Kitasatospora sp. NPDC048286 TaxID=3364047 RepID=UPI00371C75FD